MARRPKTRFKRRQATREPRLRMLVICEGSKTEPSYLRALVRDLKLTSVEVDIRGSEIGTDPVSVVRYGIKRVEDDPGTIDRVYFVFDSDSHANFDAAVDLAKNRNFRRTRLSLVRSVPCFEYWLLLHFENTSRPFRASGKYSKCDNCIRGLMRHLPDYAKGNVDTYALTKHKLNVAISNSKRRMVDCDCTGTFDPSTEMHNLVEDLVSLSEM